MRGVARYITGLALLCLGALPSPARQNIQMTAQPVFTGMSGRGVTPIVVTLQNTGPSVDGSVTVEASMLGAGGHSYVYPVSLPTGSIKKVVTYPRVDGYLDTMRVSFTGDFQGTKPSVDVPVDATGSFSVALVGDQASGLGALRSLQPVVDKDDPAHNALPFRDAYTAPENAPDRAAGYATLTALVLSNGAERLNPKQWEAIRHWAMAGGIVICTGGAGAVYLQTPGAATLLPVRDVRGTSVSSLGLPDLKAALPAGPYAVMTGPPTAGASVAARDGGHVTMAARRLGAGTVLFLAFSPFEAPLRGWKGLPDFWMMVVYRGMPAISWQGLRNTTYDLDSSGFVRAATAGTPGGPLPGTPTKDPNPFHLQLPSLGLVAGIFALYFLMAVPVSFFVLRRMKRLEWAWVTSPMLAGIFAFVFYLFGAHLYAAGTSRRTAGALVSAANSGDALFLGTTQLFFARGGNHHLEVPDAESLELPSQEGYPGASGRMKALTTVDTGTVSAPDFSVPNLAFRDIYYVQPVSLSAGLTARLSRGADGSVGGTIHNGTGRDITDITILAPVEDRWMELKELKAGETARVNATKRVWTMFTPPAGKQTVPKSAAPRRVFVPALVPLAERFRFIPVWTPDRAAGHPGGALLMGRISGEALGPQVGRYVPDGIVEVVISLPVEGGA